MSLNDFASSSPYSTVAEVRGFDRGSAPPPNNDSIQNYVLLVPGENHFTVLTDLGQGSFVTFRGVMEPQRTRYVSERSVERAQAFSKALDESPHTVADQVTTLREQLGLTVAEIADWMRVTRPAVYGWLKDVQPQPETALKLAEVANATRAVAMLKLERPDFVLKRPLFGGLSALDVLRAGQVLSTDQLSVLKALDARESDQRRASASGVAVRTLRDVLDDSTPLIQG